MVEGKRQGGQRLLKMQDKHKRLETNAEKPRTLWKLPFSWEGPEVRHCGSAQPDFRPPGPQHGDFRESPSYLSRGSAPRWRPPDKPPQAGWTPGLGGGVSLWKASSRASTRSLWSTPECQGFCLRPPSAVIRQLLKPGILSQVLNQIETIKLLQRKEKTEKHVPITVVWQG